jgi:phenylacetic acid degradation operon negative regulatory protein
LIVSLYRLYAWRNNGWLSVAAVVRLMAELRVDGQAVRSSISRLKRRGLLVARRLDGAAGYEPRAQLTHLPFGTVAPGVWVAPGHLETEANELLERLEVTSYAEVFHGRQVAFGDLPGNVSRWWDLDALRTLYAGFLDRYRPVRDRWLGRAINENATAFAEYVELVTAWRQLPYADPGLPLELLPPDWNGVEAEELFADLRELLAGPAGVHARAVLGPALRG